MGFWNTLGKIGGIAGSIAAIPFTGGASAAAIPALSAMGSIAGAAGSALGGMSDAKAKNRDAELSAQHQIANQLLMRDKNYNDASLAYEKEGREGQGQAMARLLATQRRASPSAMPNVSPYAAAPRQRTEMETGADDLLAQQMMLRLQGGNPLPKPQLTDLQIDRGLMKPGTGENLTGWLSAGLGGLSAYERLRRGMGTPPVMNADTRVKDTIQT